ncbi:MAG: hypothetical protein LUF78_03310 [Clostridiales bacterium]|nr:hypothetical protein [Clostridiales bacterium]
MGRITRRKKEKNVVSGVRFLTFRVKKQRKINFFSLEVSGKHIGTLGFFQREKIGIVKKAELSEMHKKMLTYTKCLCKIQT